MNAIQNIINALEENGIGAVIVDTRDRTLTVVNLGTPIHGVTFDQIEELYTMDAFAPNVADILVSQGIIPRSSWNG